MVVLENADVISIAEWYCALVYVLLNYENIPDNFMLVI